MNEQFDLILSQALSIFIGIGLAVICLVFVGLFLYMLFQWFRYRKREAYALDFVTLQVKLPKENEIKIDAAEQMFASLYSLKKTGFLSFLDTEDIFSFEMVAMKEDIAFYVNCPRKIRDLVEKQIHGAYPGADIAEQDEVNIFSEKGRVAFASLILEKEDFFPIKNYKDLPTDGLSLITSAMSKLGDGEGAIIQILLQPEGKLVGKP